MDRGSIGLSRKSRRRRFLAAGIWGASMTEAAQPGGQSADPRLQLLLAGLTAVRGGDFSTRLPHTGDPLMVEIATVFNSMTDQLALFTSEVTRVAREVGTDGKLGGQAQVPGVAGTWLPLRFGTGGVQGVHRRSDRF